MSTAADTSGISAQSLLVVGGAALLGILIAKSQKGNGSTASSSGTPVPLAPSTHFTIAPVTTGPTGSTTATSPSSTPSCACPGDTYVAATPYGGQDCATRLAPIIGMHQANCPCNCIAGSCDNYTFYGGGASQIPHDACCPSGMHLVVDSSGAAFGCSY